MRDEQHGEEHRDFEHWMEAHRERDVEKMLGFVTDDIVIRRSGSDFAPRRGKEEVRCHWLDVSPRSRTCGRMSLHSGSNPRQHPQLVDFPSCPCTLLGEAAWCLLLRARRRFQV